MENTWKNYTFFYKTFKIHFPIDNLAPRHRKIEEEEKQVLIACLLTDAIKLGFFTYR